MQNVTEIKRLYGSIDSIEQIPKSQIKSWNIFAPGGSLARRVGLARCLTNLFHYSFSDFIKLQGNSTYQHYFISLPVVYTFMLLFILGFYLSYKNASSIIILLRANQNRFVSFRLSDLFGKHWKIRKVLQVTVKLSVKDLVWPFVGRDYYLYLSIGCEKKAAALVGQIRFDSVT